jgi:DNA-nicking Smr family endonuclease
VRLQRNTVPGENEVDLERLSRHHDPRNRRIERDVLKVERRLDLHGDRLCRCREHSYRKGG